MNNSNEVIMLIGAPGSGKSTWGEKFANDNGYIYLSSDKNRARLGKGEDDQDVSARAFALLKEEMEKSLTNGENVILDATFMHHKARKDFIKISKKFDVYLRAVIFKLPREIIIERNALRAASGGRNVPEAIIDRMLYLYEEPTLIDFDEITTINETNEIVTKRRITTPLF